MLLLISINLSFNAHCSQSITSVSRRTYIRIPNSILILIPSSESREVAWNSRVVGTLPGSGRVQCDKTSKNILDFRLFYLPIQLLPCPHSFFQLFDSGQMRMCIKQAEFDVNDYLFKVVIRHTNCCISFSK
jgi:hypothetical protein